ncbi:MAG TPA: isochorismate synthase [Acidimicrobiia bacterium]|nr:isochorismate synthase [Acidimicrobiia bacterium]
MTRIRAAEIDPLSTPLAFRPDLVWMSTGVSIFGWGEALRLAAGFGADRFARAEAGLADWIDAADTDLGPGLEPVAFASFTFDDRSAGSVLVVPALTIVRQGDRWYRVTVDDARWDDVVPASVPDGPADRPRYAGASIPDVQWLESVATAIELIADGAAEKVVLARDYALWSKTPFDPVRLLSRLEDRFPDCYVFLVDGLVGASPELLVRLDGRIVTSQTLAGSAARSDDPVEDERLGKELLASDKELREHSSAAASVGRVLGELCDRLEREAEPSLLRLANVQHIATRFEGELARPMSALQVAARLHPTAAVGGTPTGAAVELIRRLEHMDRGRYAGPVGWMRASGDGEFAIALRCAELSGARARLFAGAGIVSGSLPEAELEETRIKLLAMQSAFE